MALMPRWMVWGIDVSLVLVQRHSGARRRREPQMRNCASGNLEIPILVLRTIPE
jgi:hypothetical protein